MAFGSYLRVTHKALSGDTTFTYQIDVLKDGFGGSVTELEGLGSIFDLRYDQIDPHDLFSNPVQNARLELHLAIENATHLGYLEEILGAGEDTYRLELSIDSSVYWTGAVLPDMIEYSEGDYPFPGTIVAKDLTGLKGADYTLDTGYDKIITVAADVLSDLSLGLDINTITSWTETNISSSDDFLNQIYLNKERIRKFATAEGESDQPYTKWEVMEAICRNFGLILRQQDGAWYFIQPTALDTDPALVNTYDSTGTQTASQSSTDLDVSVDYVNTWLLPSGRNRAFTGIKRVRAEFEHETRNQIVNLPTSFLLEDTDSDRTYEMFFNSDGNQSFSLTGRAEATGAGGETSIAALVEFRIIRPSNPDYYWDDDNETWTTTQTDVEIELVNFGGTWIYYPFSIQTGNTPADADGTFRLTIRRAQDQDDNVVPETVYSYLDFDVQNETIDQGNKRVIYQLTQTGDFSQTYEIPLTWFGDGPAPYSLSALSYLNVGQVATNDQWMRIGEMTEIKMHRLLCREVLDLQRNVLERKRADLVGDYNTKQILNADSKRYFFLGGTLSGKMGRWDAEFYRINPTTASDTFEAIFEGDDNVGTGTGSTSGGGSTNNDSVYLRLDASNDPMSGELDMGSNGITNLSALSGGAIGSDVQAFDANLQDISGLANTNGNFIVGNGANFVAESGNTARTSLGLGTGDSPTFAGLTSTGDVTQSNTTGSLKKIFDIDNSADKYASVVNRVDGSLALAYGYFQSATAPETRQFRIAVSEDLSTSIRLKVPQAGDVEWILDETTPEKWKINTGDGDFEIYSEVAGNYRTRWLLDSTGLKFGHNSTSRDIQFQTGDTTRFGIAGGGTIKAYGNMQADNFSSGSTGWQIQYDGDGEFKDITIRGTADITTAQIQTLRTTLFKPTTVNGLGGETIFNSLSTVVSIDTGANTIVAEDAVFSNGDKVIVSSAIYNQSGFSNVELNITSGGSAVSGGTEYSYTVNSGDEADIDTGDTIIKINGDLVYVDATEGASAPRIAGYDSVTGFADSPASGGTANPVWELTATGGIIGGANFDLNRLWNHDSGGGLELNWTNQFLKMYEDDGSTARVTIDGDSNSLDTTVTERTSTTTSGNPSGEITIVDYELIAGSVEATNNNNDPPATYDATIEYQGWDGGNWVNIDTQAITQTAGQSVTYPFMIKDETGYTKFRTRITAVTGNWSLTTYDAQQYLSEMQMSKRGISILGGALYLPGHPTDPSTNELSNLTSTQVYLESDGSGNYNVKVKA